MIDQLNFRDMVERPVYDALAEDINLDDITSCEGNADILRMLRGDDPNWDKEKLFILNEDEDEEGLDGLSFVIDEGDDLGWLGYFVGKSEVLEDLHIWYLPEGGDEINRFFDGMSQNRSIKSLNVSNDIGVDGWSRLGNFLENNRNLARFEVEHFVVEQEGIQHLTSALGRMNHNSLKHLSMNSTHISDEGLAEIATALRLQPQLESLELNNNNIGRDGCIALGNMLSRWSVPSKLQLLNLASNAIDDDGLQALVSGLMNCCSLKQLYLGWNQLITEAGLRSLSPLLQSEAHCLETLSLFDINFGNDGAVALAEGLRGNKSLKDLCFIPSTAGMTAVGWSAFSKLLCDTSTINNTYLSNHTLTSIRGDRETPEDIVLLLTMNTYQQSCPCQQAAICKILRSHPDLDMEPFFRLKISPCGYVLV